MEVSIANPLPLAVGTWLHSRAPDLDAPGQIAGDLSSDDWSNVLFSDSEDA